MLKNVLVYISGPITAKHGFTVEQNVADAVKVFIELTERGIPSICTQMGAAFPSAFNLEYQRWMEYDFALLDFCTHMLMLPRWRASTGAQQEIVYAEDKKIPIFYTIEDLVKALGL